ncbi:MAG TPA: hypothetical protein VL308_20625 [Gemmatimonadaceae bacterium]|jgi:hypothetical protein|nr:hypothetical protein [Gemmatimonadaceae bacterium]
MDNEIRRELRLLKVYATVITALLGTVSIAAFRQASQKQRFTEIDVERINVVEPDGKLRMVISNRPRSIGPIYKGKPFGYPGGSRPGIIFFNDEGTENGGLTFEGKRQPDGTFRAQSGFSFDQFNQDQVLYFQYNDNNGRRNMGLTIADRADVDIYDLVAERDSITKAIPEGPARTAALQKWAQPRNGVPLAAPRVYVGRDASKAAVLNLSDRNGKPRLRLTVDSLGTPSLEFLDATGNVTSRLPEK